MNNQPPSDAVIAPVVATRIRTVRRARDLSIRQLARKAGISSAAVSHIENGHRIPSLEMIENLAAALDATPWALLAAPEPCSGCGGQPEPGSMCLTCGLYR